MANSICFVITVDGPSASGKGTLARRLAKHFCLRYLDTGSIYRAIAFKMEKNGCDSLQAELAERIALRIAKEDLNEPELRREDIGLKASVIAAYPKVREAVLDYQREFAYTLPGAVLDGRDIGTVVCPNATAKIYLDANREIRVTRRLKELQLRGMESIEAHVLLEMKERDKRDKKRSVAPLKLAQDACLIDSSNLTEDEVFENAVCFIEKKYGEVV
tara:strand:- start:61 stop:711 length:651 start_codon:yes stop_codon:yes gene_type:complete